MTTFNFTLLLTHSLHHSKMTMYPYLLLFLLCNVLTSLSSGQIVNDEPGGNTTLMFQEIPGFCPQLPEARTIQGPHLMEGRWFGVQVGFLPSQAQTITCVSWDSFYDQQEVFHNFITFLENGEIKTVNSRLTPTFKYGVYTIDVGAPNNDVFFASLYYCDGGIFIFGEVVCRENGNHYRNVVVGVRDLRILEVKGALIHKLVAELEIESGIVSDKTMIFHPPAECMNVYPELRRNPYITNFF